GWAYEIKHTGNCVPYFIIRIKRRKSMNIRSVKEQYELRNQCLKERLETILPRVMMESEADLWLHASKEYNEDPTFRALTPAQYPTARRITMFAFVKDGEDVI